LKGWDKLERSKCIDSMISERVGIECPFADVGINNVLPNDGLDVNKR
jgi:hypothetical protein